MSEIEQLKAENRRLRRDNEILRHTVDLNIKERGRLRNRNELLGYLMRQNIREVRASLTSSGRVENG